MPLFLVKRSMVAMDRSNRVDYSVQCGRLRALSERWRPRQILAEQNSIGQPIIEQLSRDGLQVQPFTTTNASKAEAVEALVLALERGEIRILNDPVLVGELVAYQAERLPSGVLRYGAPPGQHDERVMAAWSAVSALHRLVYPVAESNLIVPPFNIPDYWPRVYGLEIGSSSVAAIWAARDPQTPVLYLYDEYYGSDGDPLVHAREIRQRGSWIGGVIDPAGNGRNRMDGYRLIQMYQDDLGLKLEAAEDKLFDSDILAVQQRMIRGELKVFSTLTKYLEELWSYHRDASGHVLKSGDQLQNATRYLVGSGISQMRTKPVRDELFEWAQGQAARYQPPGGLRGWMMR